MKYGIYCMRDEASGIFLAPDVSPNDEVAVRQFDFALEKNDMMHFRPEDFSLWAVGTFDDQTGVIDAGQGRMIKRGVKRGKK